jgi:hypothetical protein
MVVGKPKAIRSACTVQETLHKSVATPSLWILEKRPSCGQFLGGRISSHGVFWELLCGDLRVRVRNRRRNRVVKRRRRRKTSRN